MDLDELSNYIHFRTKSHIEEALQENYGLFMAIDKNPKDGKPRVAQMFQKLKGALAIIM